MFFRIYYYSRSDMNIFLFFFSLINVVLYVAIANGLLCQLNNNNPTVESFVVRDDLESMTYHDNESSVYKEHYKIIDILVPAKVEYQCQRTLQIYSQYKVISSLLNEEKQWYYRRYKFRINSLYGINMNDNNEICSLQSFITNNT